MELRRSRKRVLADPAFAALLSSDTTHALDEDESIAIGVWPDLTTAYFNDAYLAAAKTIGGEAFLDQWGLGRSILDPAPPLLRESLRSLYASSLNGEKLVAHAYLCPTPAIQRRFRATYHALRDKAGVLVVHRLAISTPLRAPDDSSDEVYRDDEGLLRQCANCRATRNREGSRWDYVPRYIVKMPPQVSLGLCPGCETYF